MSGERRRRLLGRRVLGDGFRSFRHGVLGQFTGQQQAHCSLDFPTRDCRALVVVSQAARFGSDSLKDVVDEAVHDAHGFAGDASVGVNLLQDFVDVDGVALLPPPFLLLVTRTLRLGLGSGLFRSFTCSFGCHN